MDWNQCIYYFFDMLMAKMANLDVNNSEYIFLQLLLGEEFAHKLNFLSLYL